MQDIPTLDGKDKQMWRDAIQARLTQLFRHASQAARLRRQWFPEIWRWGVDAVGDVDDEDVAEVEESEVNENPPPPPTTPQAKPPSLAKGESWFAAQFREHQGAPHGYRY